MLSASPEPFSFRSVFIIRSLCFMSGRGRRIAWISGLGELSCILVPESLDWFSIPLYRI